MSRVIAGLTVAMCLIGLKPITAAGNSQQDYKLSSVGGFPNSDTITSMWLADPKGKPLLMAFFSGPVGWHKTKWHSNATFQKNGPGWAEFKSERATLRLWLDPETGKAEVQAANVNIHEGNVFLVLNITEKPDDQKIIPLGTFDIAKSGDGPASDQLLRDHPELQDRILKEISSGTGK